MAKCAYCPNPATTSDAVGLPACATHAQEADAYFAKRYGRDPNADTFEYCNNHFDFWLAGCPRCETCCQHHYGMSIAEAEKAGLFRVELVSFGNADHPTTTQTFFPSHTGDET